MTEVKPGEKDVKLNSQEGDEVEDELDFELEDDKEDFEDDEDDDKQESEIDLINKATGKKFSKEALIEYIKKVDKDYAQKKVAKVVEAPQTDKPVTDVTMSERLLKLEQPASKFVIDEIKRDHPGKDPYAVWEQSEYYRNEASTREAKENAKKRVGNPSGRVGDDGEGKTEAEKIEDKFMDPNTLPPGFKFNKTK